MISVLLPVYNGEKFIAQAIQSILNQTYKDFEFLIIDDGSTDNTARVIKSFSDKRIKYFYKEHTGLADTLNYGLKIAKYDWIARMDADDISLPNRFEKQLLFLMNNPEVDILSSWYADFSNKIIFVTKTAAEHDVIKKKLLLWADICHPSVIMKKNLLNKLGGYKNNIFKKDVFVDYKLWLDIKDKVTFCNLQKVLLLKRFLKQSLSKDKMKSIKKIHYAIQEGYYEDLEKHFGLKTTAEQNYYKGLREYFWGDKNKARKYWLKLLPEIVNYPKVLILFLLTYLNEDLLIKFNEFRPWQRFEMLKMKCKPSERKMITELNEFLIAFQKKIK